MSNLPTNPQQPSALHRYWAVYKCSLCGALIRMSDEAVEVPRDSLLSLAGKVMAYQEFASNPYLVGSVPPRFIPHKCFNSSPVNAMHACGMAYFAGFEQAPDKK